MKRTIGVCFALLALVNASAAEPEARYNAVELRAEVQREVPNDMLSAMLYVELNDPHPAALASALNKRANEALRIAGEYKDVRARSGPNQTTPVYTRGNVLQGWRGRAEIRIESRDFAAASNLIGNLQSGMQLGRIAFTVSPEARRQAEDELISESIAAFRARSEIVRRSLSGRSYKIQRLAIHAGASGPSPRVALAAATAEVTPPNFEAGVSVVSVTAAGTIEVIE